MKHVADVIVIGGGVNGCSIAYNLAKKGCRNVVVVERDSVASGASGRCPGGFRHQWGTEADIRLMEASIRLLVGLKEELACPADLEIRQYGYLFLAYTEAEMEQFRKNVQLQSSLGIPVELLDLQQVRELAPGLVVDGLVGGTFCAWDGRANPLQVTHAYAWAARQLGVGFYLSTDVTGLATDGSKVRGVITSRGVIEAPKVVCAAGVASVQIAGTAGVDLPITPLRRQVSITERMERPKWPAVVSRYVICFQTRDGDLMAAVGRPEPEEVNDTASVDSIVGTAKAWTGLAPFYEKAKVVRMWAGTYDMTPDAHPIVGPIPEVDGLYVAAGFSGHGFMMAPIVGKAMAELLLGQPTSVDISDLQLERFRRGGHAVERMVY